MLLVQKVIIDPIVDPGIIGGVILKSEAISMMDLLKQKLHALNVYY